MLIDTFSTGVRIAAKPGTWKVIGVRTVAVGREFLLESENYAGTMPYLIVDRNANIKSETWAKFQSGFM